MDTTDTMDTITNLRKYRVLESPTNLFNADGKGIAIFDLVSSIIGFYLIDLLYGGKLFKAYGYKYYAFVIPFGIVVHLILDQNTFLSKQLFSSEINIHKIIVAVIIIYLAL
jgi:hypothetical protein